MTSPRRHSKVVVISLGGTIASTPGAGDESALGVQPNLSVEDIVASVPGLYDVAELEAVAFRQVPSGDLDLDDMVALAQIVERHLNDGAAGVVIVQGTDTLEETSFALDLLVRAERPVVVTGAMRNPTVVGADGAANLLAAVQVAVSEQAAGLGTLVVANDQIHAARFVRKTHATSVATFQSPSAGPLGWVSEGRARIVLRVSRLHTGSIGAIGTVPPVALLTAVIGDDARWVAVLEEMGYRGLVVEAFGAGHVASRMMPALTALARRVPVVFASRTGAGEVLRATYAFAGSESDMLARGLISAGAFDGPKARVLLSLLLARGLDLEGVRAGFDESNASMAFSDV